MKFVDRIISGVIAAVQNLFSMAVIAARQDKDRIHPQMAPSYRRYWYNSVPRYPGELSLIMLMYLVYFQCT